MTMLLRAWVWRCHVWCVHVHVAKYVNCCSTSLSPPSLPLSLSLFSSPSLILPAWAATGQWVHHSFWYLELGYLISGNGPGALPNPPATPRRNCRGDEAAPCWDRLPPSGRGEPFRLTRSCNTYADIWIATNHLYKCKSLILHLRT